jgi:hypothetical protein
MVDHALLLFIFQQDLGVQLQRALNMERFELAAKIREKRREVCTSAPPAYLARFNASAVKELATREAFMPRSMKVTPNVMKIIL